MKALPQTTRTSTSWRNGFAGRIRDLFFSRRLEIGLLTVIPAAFLVKPGNMFGSHLVVGTAVSVILIFAGMVLRAWAGGCAGDHTGESTIRAPRLATGGPYAYVRNPIYLGTILIGLGMVGVIGDSRLLLLCLITFAVLYTVIIPSEENFLHENFGTEYEAYLRAVPRLIPRPVPWKESRKASFNRGIFAGEARIAVVLLFVYGAMKFAIFLKY